MASFVNIQRSFRMSRNYDSESSALGRQTFFSHSAQEPATKISIRKITNDDRHIRKLNEYIRSNLFGYYLDTTCTDKNSPSTPYYYALVSNCLNSGSSYKLLTEVLKKMGIPQITSFTERVDTWPTPSADPHERDPGDDAHMVDRIEDLRGDIPRYCGIYDCKLPSEKSIRIIIMSKETTCDASNYFSRLGCF